MIGVILFMVVLKLNVVVVSSQILFQNETIAYCSLQSIDFDQKENSNLTQLCQTNNSILCDFQNVPYCYIANISSPLPTKFQLTNVAGTIPSQLGLLSNLIYFGIKDSPQLTGTIPTQLGQLSKLTILDLSSNSLSGMIPTQLGKFSQCYELDLSSNSLSGTIPTQLGNFPHCYYFDISFNSLSGTIPSQLAGDFRDGVFYVNNNFLSGTIPTQFGLFAGLQYFDISHNNISGTIPTQLGNLTWCRMFTISNNLLSGTIPTQLGEFSILNILDISHNSLSGTIPTQLGNLNNYIQYFLISDNHLSGTIPTQLGKLYLNRFNISNNPLSGSIPEQLGYWGFNYEIYIAGTDLCGGVPKSWLSYDIQQCLIYIPHNCSTKFPPNCQTISCDDSVQCFDFCGTGTDECSDGRTCKRISKFGGYTCSDCIFPYENDGLFKCYQSSLWWAIPLSILLILISAAIGIFIYKKRNSIAEKIPLITLSE